jgi:biopolymer transport protein ExbD
MQLIPHDDLKIGQNFNFTPMIDFLFLMLSLFATLAISRAKLFDSEVSLVAIAPSEKTTSLHSQNIQQIDISISANGEYKWLTEYNEYPMDSIVAIQQELVRQYEMGVLPQNKNQTEVRLHIDQKAPWKPIAEAIFAIRELGFKAHPVYEPASPAIKDRKNH